MKRVISACVEQTLRFSAEADWQAYAKVLQRKRVRYKVVDQRAQPDGAVIVKIVRDYLAYPVGDYFD